MGSLAVQAPLGGDSLVAASPSWSECSPSSGDSPLPLARASWGCGQSRSAHGAAGRTGEPFVGPQLPRSPPSTAASVPTSGSPPRPGVHLGSYPPPCGWPPSGRSDRVAVEGWSPLLWWAPTAANLTPRPDPLVPRRLPSRGPPTPAGVSACQAAEPLHSSQPPSRDPAESPVDRSHRPGALPASGRRRFASAERTGFVLHHPLSVACRGGSRRPRHQGPERWERASPTQGAGPTLHRSILGEGAGGGEPSCHLAVVPLSSFSLLSLLPDFLCRFALLCLVLRRRRRLPLPCSRFFSRLRLSSAAHLEHLECGQ